MAIIEDYRVPDDVRTVAVEGGNVVTYSYGQSDEVILILNGGPGAASEHMRVTHCHFADQGFRVVFFDQLGTGKSDNPGDPALWTIERYVREVEAVRQALQLGRVHIYGHSWGCMLAIEYTLTYPDSVRSCVFSHGIADVPFHQQEVDRLIAAFGPEFVRMRRRYELTGQFDHPEYQASETVLLFRHALPMHPWPDILRKDISEMNQQIRKTMVGEEYYWHGNLKKWNRLKDMHRITQPVLVQTGEYDALTPMEAAQMVDVLPNARLEFFADITHIPFYECPDKYYASLSKFWNEVRGA